MFAQMINILTSPVKAFESLKQQPNFLFPLLLIVILSAGGNLLVFQLIDFEYFVEMMIEQTLMQPNAPPESEVRQGMSVLNPMLLSIGSVAGALIGVPVIYSLYSLYLWLIGKLGAEELGFKHFFSTVCWSGIPNLIALIAILLMVFLSPTRQFGPADMNPLSIQSLFFKGVEGFPSGLANLSIVSFWTLGLLITGYRVLTESSWIKAAVIVLIPPVLIFGGLALLTS